MKKIIAIIIVLSLNCFAYSKKVAVLTEVNNPKNIVPYKDKIYFVEKASIYIYSNKDYKFIKKFGKKGEGPREFKPNPLMGGLTIHPLSDNLQINSIGKISYYTLDGNFIKEMTNHNDIGLSLFYPLGDKFVGTGSAFDGIQGYLTTNIYSSKLKKKKLLQKIHVSTGNTVQLLKTSFALATCNNKIFMAAKNGLKINVYDFDGKKIKVIEHPYKKLPFTSKNKKEILYWYKSDHLFKEIYDIIKKSKFPKFFPEIRSIILSNNILYIQTFHVKDNKTEFFIFSDQGKFLKQIWLKIFRNNPVESYQIFNIYNNMLYQLYDNDEEETWELHVDEINLL